MTPQEYRKHDVDGKPRTIERIWQERQAAIDVITKVFRWSPKIGSHDVAAIAEVKKAHLQHYQSGAQRLDSEAYRRLWNFLNGEGK